MLEKNKIYLGDCLEVMKEIDNNSIDLTVTSPPYDNLRTYNGSLVWGEDVWQEVIRQLFRVTKFGGVVVWVVGDATIGGSETGTSFKQALWFKECGFDLYDTMIWNKECAASVGSLKRYESVFEYMFVFSKSSPITTNIIKDKPNKRAGELQYGSIRHPDGVVRKTSNYGKKAISQFGRRHNIWDIFPVKSAIDRGHPAPFPVQLVADHITTWSNLNEIVFDPFIGSGTTAIAAIKTGRYFIGIEKEEKYFNLANERILKAKNDE